MNQQQVWNNIAGDWRKFRDKSPSEVEEFLKNKKGKVLDLGCGSGRNFIKNKNITFYGVDFSQKMLNFAKKNAKKGKKKVRLFQSETEKLPFKSNFFDSAIFISTLHCIDTKQKRKKTLLELYRVMKHGTGAMISVWDKRAKKNIASEAKEGLVLWKNNQKKLERYYYFYEKEELKQELKECGFQIIKQKSIAKTIHSRKNIIFYIKKN